MQSIFIEVNEHKARFKTLSIPSRIVNNVDGQEKRKWFGVTYPAATYLLNTQKYWFRHQVPKGAIAFGIKVSQKIDDDINIVSQRAIMRSKLSFATACAENTTGFIVTGWA